MSNAVGKIDVQFEHTRDFYCVFSSGTWSVDFSTMHEAGQYMGLYEVTPSAEEQTLETINKRMSDNVTVHATPYSEASNEAGGYTVTIL